MDAVEVAIANLKCQRALVEREIAGYRVAIKEGCFLRPKRTLQRWIRDDKAKVEAMDYVLNILENPEEALCQD